MKYPQLLAPISAALFLSSCAFTNFHNMIESPDEVSVYSTPKKESGTGRTYADVYTYEVDEPWYSVFGGTCAVRRISLTRTDAAPSRHYLTQEEQQLHHRRQNNNRWDADFRLRWALPIDANFSPEQQHLTVNCITAHPMRSEYLLWGRSEIAPQMTISEPPQNITLRADGDTPLNGEQKWWYVDRICSLPIALTPIGGLLLLYEWNK